MTATLKAPTKATVENSAEATVENSVDLNAKLPSISQQEKEALKKPSFPELTTFPEEGIKLSETLGSKTYTYHCTYGCPTKQYFCS
jgi:hypothetical protein